MYLSSVGKTFVMACFGIAVKDGEDGIIAHLIDEHSKVYDPLWLRAGFPLSDGRNNSITVHHIFTHTSRLAPQATKDGEEV